MKMRSVLSALVGGMAGFVVWIVMIGVTGGICSVPVLSLLMCASAPGTITFDVGIWDTFLLVLFVGGGARAGWEFGS